MNGTLIVIDGIDGSGKATQSQLLTERLLAEGHSAEKIDFPRYGRSVFGELLMECLAGKHGDFQHLDPKIASILYSLDRYEAATQLREWMQAGRIVIADRYSTSNQIHQGGKIVDVERRNAFLQWIERVEHDILDVPRPSGVIHLRMPVEVSARLIREAKVAKNPLLAAGEKDVVEKDRMYLERSFESAEHMAKNSTWHVVECMDGDRLRTPEEIHEDVYSAVVKMLV